MNLELLLLTPPAVFVILIVVNMLLSAGFSGLAFKNKNPSPDSRKPYACGEDIVHHKVRPNYKQFFAFAFFFTIMHVTALIVTTIPKITESSAAIAFLFLAGALVSLFILFRR